MIRNKFKVTVGVVSFNSSRYVLETLNSVLAQSIGPEYIRLIISDDASVDSTLSVINEWLEEHADKFSSVDLLIAEKNSGTVSNVNKVLAATQTQWVKLIAADDYLDKNCLETFMAHMEKGKVNRETAAIFSDFVKFYGKSHCRMPNNYTRKLISSNLSADRLLLYMRLGFGNVAPSALLNADIVKEVGGVPECYDLLDDLPLWDLLLERGFNFSYVHSVTAYYRVHSEQTVSMVLNSRIAADLEMYAKGLMARDGFVYKLVALHRLYNLYTARLYSDHKISFGLARFMRALNPINCFIWLKG